MRKLGYLDIKNLIDLRDDFIKAENKYKNCISNYTRNEIREYSKRTFKLNLKGNKMQMIDKLKKHIVEEF